MLGGIARDGVGGADPFGPPPEHVLMPGAAQLLLQRQAEVPGAQIADHRVDDGERRRAVLRRLEFRAEGRHGARPGLHQVLRGGGAEGVLARLCHQVRDVDELRGFDDSPVADVVELRVAQHHEFPRRSDAQPWRVEQAHQVAHRHDPNPGKPVDFIETGEKDVLPPLQAGERCQKRCPERLGDRLCTRVSSNGTHAAPVPVGMRVLGQSGGDRAGSGGGEGAYGGRRRAPFPPENQSSGSSSPVLHGRRAKKTVASLASILSRLFASVCKKCADNRIPV
jgi:hypothetical protein